LRIVAESFYTIIFRRIKYVTYTVE